MHRHYLIPAVCCFALAASSALANKAPESFELAAKRQPGDAVQVTVALEVGGDLLVPETPEGKSKLPMSVVASLAYSEQLLSWSADPAEPARALRQYTQARATIKTDEQGAEPLLPADRRTVVAELAGSDIAIAGLDQPLSREQYDLLDVVGNSLAIDRILPNRAMKKDESWDVDAAAIGPLLGMDHVAVCEVRSTVVGMEKRQVQLRLAGVVHGTVEGAVTEMNLRGAYLFHLDEERITKFNLTIEEKRKAGEVNSGLDVVAKLTLVAAPLDTRKALAIHKPMLEKARDMKIETLRQIAVDAPARGYRFAHDTSWYVTAEKREQLSLRLLEQGDLLAHCNVTTLPPRLAGNPMTLADFEKDVVKSLGDKIDKVETATEWTSVAGRHCLGVFANGTVEDVPVQWRYYHVADDAGRRATISVTVEQSLLVRFADADRPIVDSMELIDMPAVETAAEESDVKK